MELLQEYYRVSYEESDLPISPAAGLVPVTFSASANQISFNRLLRNSVLSSWHQGNVFAASSSNYRIIRYYSAPFDHEQSRSAWNWCLRTFSNLSGLLRYPLSAARLQIRLTVLSVLMSGLSAFHLRTVPWAES